MRLGLARPLGCPPRRWWLWGIAARGPKGCRLMKQLSYPVDSRAAAVLWPSLTQDLDANVMVLDREGNILFANEQASRWVAWCARVLTGESEEPVSLPETCPPEQSEERLRLQERVCDTGRGVTFETIAWGMRWRITFRPLPSVDGPTHLLHTARRMQPWERLRPGDRLGDLDVISVRHHSPGAFAQISARELDVLILIGEGLSYAEIAAHLHRSIRTIERHRDQLGRKLGATNRVQLARYAIRAGLCALPAPPEAFAGPAQDFNPLDVSPAALSIARRRQPRARTG